MRSKENIGISSIAKEVYNMIQPYCEWEEGCCNIRTLYGEERYILHIGVVYDWIDTHMKNNKQSVWTHVQGLWNNKSGELMYEEKVMIFLQSLPIVYNISR